MNDFNTFDVYELFNDPMFPDPVPYPNNDLIFINQRLEQLSVEVNTQNIKLELETIKRQRLRRSLKQAKIEIATLSQLLAQQSQEQAILREQLATLSDTLFSELACLTQRTHCCIGRIHHLLIAAVPRIYMSKAEHNDLAQQATELLRALQLIRIVAHRG